MPAVQNIIDEETGFRKVEKTPETDRLYDIEMASGDLRSGDTIATFDSIDQTNMGKVSGSSNLATSGLTHDASRTMQLQIGGGTVGEKYKLKYQVTMTSGDVIVDTVVMEVV